MQVNIVINSITTQDKKINTTVTYVNENATNQQLKQLATSLNALTNNTYTGTTKETKEELL